MVKSIYYIINSYNVDHINNEFIIYTNITNPNYSIFSTKKPIDKNWKLLFNQKKEHVIIRDIDIQSKYIILYLQDNLKNMLKVISLSNSNNNYDLTLDDSYTYIEPYGNIVFINILF